MRLVHLRTVILALGLVAGCKSMPEWHPDNFVPRAPSQAWVPSEEHEEPWFSQPSTNFEDVDLGATFDLARLLDIGLANNPETRASWESARAAAAGYGKARGELYPTVDVVGEGTVSNADDPDDYLDTNNDTATWFAQGGATLNYLLTDFGGRRARVGAARQALYQANWLQNQALQNVIREIATAYYLQQGHAAEVVAYEASLANTETTMAAAQARLDVGVGTISDVLQARANEAQVAVSLAGARGQTKVAQGELAIAVGWPANTRFTIEPAAEELPFEALVQDADQLIELAYQSRPLLAAGLAQVRKSERELVQARARRRPTLSSQAGVSEQLLRGENDETGFVYEAGLNLTVPIFTGGTLRSGVIEAEANLEKAQADLISVEQRVSSSVWTGYYDFRTAIDQVQANEMLLTSSTEAYDVALKRFENGLGDIVELLNAQALLADARAELVRSRTSALTSYADLVHAVGREVPTARP